MPKMVVTHAVVDVERWLQGKAERVDGFAKWATNVTDYVAADGSNNVVVTADIHDMAGLHAPWPHPHPKTRPQRSATASSNRSLRTARSSPGTASFGEWAWTTRVGPPPPLSVPP